MRVQKIIKCYMCKAHRPATTVFHSYPKRQIDAVKLDLLHLYVTDFAMQSNSDKTSLDYVGESKFFEA